MYVCVCVSPPQFQCCGNINYTDWFSIPPFNKTVPDSCCKTPSPDCGLNTTSSNIYQIGCVNLIDKWLKENFVIVAGVALGIALFQVRTIIIANNLVARSTSVCGDVAGRAVGCRVSPPKRTHSHYTLQSVP
uniref:CD63 antigen-like n=1 Tax=Callorhinchus milii TaxID=7868 RepID=A0A4W3H4F8_CALMI